VTRTLDITIGTLAFLSGMALAVVTVALVIG
jgi:hypothetical protein